MRSCLALFVILNATLGVTQEIAIDWPHKKLTASPPYVEEMMKTQIRVADVNDIFYSYSIETVGRPRDNYDFANLVQAIPAQPAGRAALAACDAVDVASAKAVQTSKQATGDVQAFLTSPVHDNAVIVKGACTAGTPCSITLAQMRDLWRGGAEQSVSTAMETYQNLETAFNAAPEPCKTPDVKQNVANTKYVSDQLSALQQRVVSSAHDAVKPITLEVDTDYDLTITEYYSTTATKDGNYKVTISPANHRFTLSAGALGTGVQNRSYSVQQAPVPNAPSQTQNILTVEGRSPVTLNAVGLLNYRIKSLGKNWSMTISTGPVFRFGSKSDTSAFGYFGGLGFQLFNRFVVAAGAHVGQYAGYPAGFSHPGQVVPSGLATPTAIKSTIVRPALALTYKVKDFGSVSSIGQFGQDQSGSTTPAKTTPKDTGKAPVTP